MAARSNWLPILAVCCLVALGGCAALGGPPADSAYNWTTVTAVDSDTNEELATVDVRIADNGSLRYTGLSNTTSLGENEGMLFIHNAESTKGYVMRNMAFPIDIVFITADGEITTIHHAQPEDDETFRGTAKYVLEVPYEYTTDNGIEEGDRIEIPEQYR
ncbi:DUF192 domain-containing protein [Halohasta litorea]|uniref:DUF192 domain-containing protein n=1 Tax=Halohasta litorea TaxID=869891 RepID=A0ABD6D4U6_9EURY|nr:DUF192 domain-containing protein [Halohasta litorea]